jgi:hypothetical protein
MTRRPGANLDQDVAVPLPAAGGGGARARRRPTRVRGGRLRRWASRRDPHSKHAKKLSLLQARQSPAPRRCAGARGHPESAANRGANADVLRARGAGSGAADRKGHPGPRLRPSAAERVFEPSPPCKGSGPTLRRLLHGARDGGAGLGNPGPSTLRITGVVRLRADHLLREVHVEMALLAARSLGGDEEPPEGRDNCKSDEHPHARASVPTRVGLPNSLSTGSCPTCDVIALRSKETGRDGLAVAWTRALPGTRLGPCRCSPSDHRARPSRQRVPSASAVKRKARSSAPAARSSCRRSHRPPARGWR